MSFLEMLQLKNSVLSGCLAAARLRAGDDLEARAGEDFLACAREGAKAYESYLGKTLFMRQYGPQEEKEKLLISDIFPSEE